MKNLPDITIPLVRPDLRQSDADIFLQQMAENPFSDLQLVAQWETAWQEIWKRPCVAFADPVELLQSLKNILGWQPGLEIQTSPLLHPIWQEAMQSAWLTPSQNGVITGSGQEIWSDNIGQTKNLIQHNFGLPAQTSSQQPATLEDISAILKPLPNCGVANIQLLMLDGNRMIQGGATCLALSTDESLIKTLKKTRKQPPAAALCALMLSQLNQLDALLARREQLAMAYLDIYSKDSVSKPPLPSSGRRWEAFIIQLPNREKRLGLQHFLNKAGIGAAPPIWHHLPTYQNASSDTSPLTQLVEKSLALPLYASLSDGEQKKIINRVHRWIDRGGPVGE
jgi:hypothetical protein